MSKYVNPISIYYMENHHIVNILVHTYSSMWNKLNDLGLQTPNAWMLPTDAHQTNPKNPLF